LNITRYLVEMQGGKIWFESVFGEGTTFQFTIPISESSIG
jgi:signal transduction histidine kinase